jgi:hypothetical protein
MESDNEDVQSYPVYLKCTKTKFNTLNKQANELLGIPNEDTKTYALPLIDKEGSVYFIVNREVSSLVDLSLCVSFDKIELPI